MDQIVLDIKYADDERRWLPEKYTDGDQFAVRLHSGVWETVILACGEWHGPDGIIDKSRVSHWAELNVEVSDGPAPVHL